MTPTANAFNKHNNYTYYTLFETRLMFQQLQQQLQDAQSQQKALVQVRVLNTEGSTYRKSGARMLIDEQGQRFDLVSGGCLETHLSRHAMQVFHHGKPLSLEYDFSDPNAADWQISVGCRGKVVLLLEKLAPENNYGSLALYLQGRQNRAPSWLITDLTSGHSHLTFNEPVAEREADLPENNLSNHPSTALDSTPITSPPHKSDNQVIEAIDPAPRLLLIGTGPDTDAIIELARGLDYQMQVIGCQSQSLQHFHHRFPNLAQRVEIDELNNYLSVNPVSYVIIMTHNQSMDAAYLSQSSLSQLPLVGLLGPAERKQRVLEEMTSPIPSNLAAPMGPDLGGHGAQAVALSVMAQIQAVHHHMLGTPLHSKIGGIHD